MVVEGAMLISSKLEAWLAILLKKWGSMGGTELLLGFCTEKERFEKVLLELRGRIARDKLTSSSSSSSEKCSLSLKKSEPLMTDDAGLFPILRLKDLFVP